MTEVGGDGTSDLRRQIVEILPRLRRFCLTLARTPDGGDDLCQAAVERALARAEQFIPGTRLDSWMYRIAQNIFIDDRRRLKTRGAEIDVDAAFDMAGDDGVQIVEGRSDMERARSALLALPEEQRTLMTLVVLDGMSYREAAVMLDIPIGTVMSRIARARRAIDRQINGDPVQ